MVTKKRCPKLTKVDLESKFQGEVIKWLKEQGCFVMKISVVAGIPRGTSDVFFCKDGFYGFLECKAAKNSERQPGQPQFVKKMSEWSYGKFIYPANWGETQQELKEMLK